MIRLIALLRGINVGGKRKILMADLKVLFTDLGFKNIETYIQSGNVLFDCDMSISAAEISTKIENAIATKFGFEVPIVISSIDEIKTAIETNPFLKDSETQIEQLHLTFLKQVAEDSELENIKNFDYSPDKFHIQNRYAFIFCNGKYHESKLTNDFFEKKLKVSTTTRNWKTVLKLYELGNK